MGQKVHPTGMRLGIVKDWNAKWYANSKDFSDMLISDIRARRFLMKELGPNAAISKIQIQRPTRAAARITIHTARPGVIIGKKGEDVERLREKVGRIMNVSVNIGIEEIRKPELEAALVASGVAQQLEKRIMFRRAMKRAVTSAMRLGAEGIKICVSGRLGGAEIARSEWYREGRVPLHTFRADIDYGVAEAHTTYGIVGVKVWIFKGEVFEVEQPVAVATGEGSSEKH